MTTTEIGSVLPDVRRVDAASRFSRQLILRRLSKLSGGRILLDDWSGITSLGNHGPLAATIRVHHPRFYSRALLGGSLGAADSYVQGDWDCDRLVGLLRLLLQNRHAPRALDRGWSSAARWVHRLTHRFRANHRAGSRRNIRAHYDLGNDFFRLWLDDSMAYSSGIFTAPQQSLSGASAEKFDRVCRKLDLQPDDHLLEIGCGWGGLAIHAARQYGCRVTATTISDEQFAFAQQRISEAGLTSRIRLIKQDYRDLEGSYDKLASIEMIEAVGHEYHDSYFRKCGELLKPGGTLLLQAIVMPERGYDRYLHSVDFIRRYVFPGGCLPSVAGMLESAGRTSRLRFAHAEDFALHYAETLRRWRATFHDQLDEVRQLGYPETLLRLWEFYLCYCEAGFEERHVGVVQVVLDNHGCRRDPLNVGERAAASPCSDQQGLASKGGKRCLVP